MLGVRQAYPFVVRKVLRDSKSGGARLLLRDMLIDSNGAVKPNRMSAVLNAALGYVAEHSEGFVDFDAVPSEGASLQVGHDCEKAVSFCNAGTLSATDHVMSCHIMGKCVYCRHASRVLLGILKA
jgi:hypothetical protein